MASNIDEKDFDRQILDGDISSLTDSYSIRKGFH